MTKKIVNIATRNSKLALWQADYIENLITLINLHPQITKQADYLPVQLPMVSTGDIRLETALSRIGGKGLFTLELEKALFAGKAQIAVHSLKDVPVEDNPAFSYSYTSRADACDVLVFPSQAKVTDLASLPANAVIGTSSLRRQAILAAHYPHLQVKLLRGNVQTRLAKLNDPTQGYSAIILAKAGLVRLGILEELNYLELDPFHTFIPAPGQGIVAVQYPEAHAQALTSMELSLQNSKTTSDDLTSLLGQEEAISQDYFFTSEQSLLNNKVGELFARLEKSIASEVGGSCSMPIGIYAYFSRGEEILDSKALSTYYEGKYLLALDAPQLQETNPPQAYQAFIQALQESYYPHNPLALSYAQEEAPYQASIGERFKLSDCTLNLRYFIGDPAGSEYGCDSLTIPFAQLAIDQDFNFDFENNPQIQAFKEQVVKQLTTKHASVFTKLKDLAH